MVKIQDLKIEIQSFLNDLQLNGYQIDKTVLFGSYAKGNPHENSDIDLAVWSPSFIGNRVADSHHLAPIISKHVLIELHPFRTGEDDPFIEEIMKYGIIFEEESFEKLMRGK